MNDSSGTRPRPVDMDVRGLQELCAVLEEEGEAGVNMISADFSIVMVNRVSERVYKKSMVQLLGRKCYEEFERRDTVCSHCPGVAALRTGQAHVVETEGVRDDGSRFSIELLAYPVIGPDDKPIGFIEVERETTEQKRTEHLMLVLKQLLLGLQKVDNPQKAMRQALDAALTLEGLDSGRIVMSEGQPDSFKTLCNRGFPEGLIRRYGRHATYGTPVLRSTSREEAGPTGELDGAKVKAFAMHPIREGREPAKLLVVGSSTLETIPPPIANGLELIAIVLGDCLDRLKGDVFRRQTASQARSALMGMRQAHCCLDHEGRVTLWNSACERMLGYRATEMMGQLLAFFPDHVQASLSGLCTEIGRSTVSPRRIESSCTTKGGEKIEVNALALPFIGVVGDSSRLLIVMEAVASNGASGAR